MRLSQGPGFGRRCLLFLVPAVLALVALAGGARAESDSVLYSFNAGVGPASPAAGPIADANGALYVPTINYSNASVDYPGAVVQLIQSAAGAWGATTLWVFTGDSGDGAYPNGLMLLNGSLYGTTFQGGDTQCPLQNGCGTVFELSPSGGCGSSSGWCDTILYRFKGGKDGMEPQAALVADKHGNLYGTTVAGGKGCQDGCGTIFEMVKAQGYREKVLYRFPPRAGTYVGKYGSQSATPLVVTANGSLLGTAAGGGSHGYGTAFELSRKGKKWNLKALHDFDGTHGAFPSSGLVAHGGAYYGVTAGDQSDNTGTLYELSQSGSKWKFTGLLYIPESDIAYGGPNGNVVFDSGTGAAYFVTNGYQTAPGAVVELASNGKAGFLHLFSGPSPSGDDAEAPYGPLLLLDGQLYGAGWAGGADAVGALFSLAP